MLLVRLIRVLNNLTLHELSRRSGISASKISLIERELEVPSNEEVRRISEVIGVADHQGSLLRPVDARRLIEAIL